MHLNTSSGIGTGRLPRDHPGKTLTLRDSLARSAGSASTTSSCSVKRTCAGSSAPMKTACSKKAFSGMGRTLHEIFRIREVRDHRTGGTVVALNPPDTGSNRDPEIDVLRLVQPIPGGRDRSSGGWQAETAANLEQDL